MWKNARYRNKIVLLRLCAVFVYYAVNQCVGVFDDQCVRSALYMVLDFCYPVYKKAHARAVVCHELTAA